MEERQSLEDEKSQTTISWLIHKAFKNDVPNTYRVITYKTDQNESIICPPIIIGLTTGQFYISALANLLKKSQDHWKNHTDVLMYLSRLGYPAIDSAGRSVTEVTLQRDAPISVGCHLGVIYSMMTLYTQEVAPISRMMNALRTLGEDCGSIGSMSVVESLQKWVTSVTKNVVQSLWPKRLNLGSMSSVQCSSIIRQLSFGTRLLCLLYQYLPQHVNQEDVTFSSLSIAQSEELANARKVIELCQRHAPYRICYFTAEQLVKKSANHLQVNFTVFVAELFHWLIGASMISISSLMQSTIMTDSRETPQQASNQFFLGNVEEDAEYKETFKLDPENIAPPSYQETAPSGFRLLHDEEANDRNRLKFTAGTQLEEFKLLTPDPLNEFRLDNSDEIREFRLDNATSITNHQPELMAHSNLIAMRTTDKDEFRLDSSIPNRSEFRLDDSATNQNEFRLNDSQHYSSEFRLDNASANQIVSNPPNQFVLDESGQFNQFKLSDIDQSDLSTRGMDYDDLALSQRIDMTHPESIATGAQLPVAEPAGFYLDQPTDRPKDITGGPFFLGDQSESLMMEGRADDKALTISDHSVSDNSLVESIENKDRSIPPHERRDSIDSPCSLSPVDKELSVSAELEFNPAKGDDLSSKAEDKLSPDVAEERATFPEVNDEMKDVAHEAIEDEQTEAKTHFKTFSKLKKDEDKERRNQCKLPEPIIEPGQNLSLKEEFERRKLKKQQEEEDKMMKESTMKKSARFDVPPNQTTWMATKEHLNEKHQQNLRRAKSMSDSKSDREKEELENRRNALSQLSDMKIRLEQRKRQIEREKQRLEQKGIKLRQKSNKAAFMHLIHKQSDSNHSSPAHQSTPAKRQSAIAELSTSNTSTSSDDTDDTAKEVPRYRDSAPPGPVVRRGSFDMGPVPDPITTPTNEIVDRPEVGFYSTLSLPTGDILETMDSVRSNLGAKMTTREPMRLSLQKDIVSSPAMPVSPDSVSEQGSSILTMDEYNHSLEKLNHNLADLQAEIQRLSLQQEQISLTLRSQSQPTGQAVSTTNLSSPSLAVMSEEQQSARSSTSNLSTQRKTWSQRPIVTQIPSFTANSAALDTNFWAHEMAPQPPSPFYPHQYMAPQQPRQYVLAQPGSSAASRPHPSVHSGSVSSLNFKSYPDRSNNNSSALNNLFNSSSVMTSSLVSHPNHQVHMEARAVSTTTSGRPVSIVAPSPSNMEVNDEEYNDYSVQEDDEENEEEYDFSPATPLSMVDIRDSFSAATPRVRSVSVSSTEESSSLNLRRNRIFADDSQSENEMNLSGSGGNGGLSMFVPFGSQDPDFDNELDSRASSARRGGAPGCLRAATLPRERRKIRVVTDDGHPEAWVEDEEGNAMGVALITGKDENEPPDIFERRRLKVLEQQCKRQEERERLRLKLERDRAMKREALKAEQEAREEKRAMDKQKKEAILNAYLTNKNDDIDCVVKPKRSASVSRAHSRASSTNKNNSSHPSRSFKASPGNTPVKAKIAKPVQRSPSVGSSSAQSSKRLSCSTTSLLQRQPQPSASPDHHLSHFNLKSSTSDLYHSPVSESHQGSPRGQTDYSGPKLFVKPKSKSNRSVISNAIKYCCLAGTVNEPIKKATIKELSSAEGAHFIILFRDARCQYRAIYSFDLETEEMGKIYGIGPKYISHEMVSKFFKYNSGAKSFTEILSTNHLSTVVDAITIHSHFWKSQPTGKCGPAVTGPLPVLKNPVSVQRMKQRTH